MSRPRPPPAGRTRGAAGWATARLRPAHADQLAGLLANSDLRGVRSHGTRAIAGYCPSIRDGAVNPNPELQVLQDTETTVLVDGDGGLGYAPMLRATELASAKAKQPKGALAAACHHGHYGSAGHYVRRAMAEDCTAFSVQAAYPQYYTSNEGKRAAHYGNPPLCFGLPGQQGPPVVLDVATCILADYQRGEEIEAIEEQIPAAFFKSMGYTAIATLLGGAFVGQGADRAREGGLPLADGALAGRDERVLVRGDGRGGERHVVGAAERGNRGGEPVGQRLGQTRGELPE